MGTEKAQFYKSQQIAFWMIRNHELQSVLDFLKKMSINHQKKLVLQVSRSWTAKTFDSGNQYLELHPETPSSATETVILYEQTSWYL